MATGKRAGYHPSLEKGAGKKDTLKKQGFYQSRAWRDIRIAALQRDHYLCQECLRKKRITKATEVHHIQPLEDHPELALELSNLRSLCWYCHEETKSHGARVAAAPPGVKIIKISNDVDADLS